MSLVFFFWEVVLESELLLCGWTTNGLHFRTEVVLSLNGEPYAAASFIHLFKRRLQGSRQDKIQLLLKDRSHSTA